MEMPIKWTFGPVNLDGVIAMLLQNTTLPRWSDEIKSHAFREDEKQCLNGQICWVLAKVVEHSGVTINWSLFPKIAIWRGFEKAAKKDIKEEVYAELMADHPLLKKALEEYVQTSAKKLTSEEFVKWLQVSPDCLEWRIYRAATAIATYIELEELKCRAYMPPAVLAKKEAIQRDRMAKYADMGCFNEVFFNGKLMELFRNFSKLRNQVRWVSNEPRVKFNDLGHSYHVACMAYTVLLMNGYEEKIATTGYFVGLFHDLPERWTGDFPSPMKDAIYVIEKDEKTGEYKPVTLRDMIDALECKVLEREVYCRLPEYMRDDFKSIMLEELPKDQKDLFKEADSLSAMVEAQAELVMGVKYFEKVYHDYTLREGWSSVIQNWLKLHT